MKEKRRVDRWWHVALYWCSIETRWEKKDALRLVDLFHTFRHAAFRVSRKYCYLQLNALLKNNKI